MTVLIFQVANNLIPVICLCFYHTFKWLTTVTCIPLFFSINCVIFLKESILPDMFYPFHSFLVIILTAFFFHVFSNVLLLCLFTFIYLFLLSSDVGPSEDLFHHKCLTLKISHNLPS